MEATFASGRISTGLFANSSGSVNERLRVSSNSAFGFSVSAGS
jgi:hypothetical protein